MPDVNHCRLPFRRATHRSPSPIDSNTALNLQKCLDPPRRNHCVDSELLLPHRDLCDAAYWVPIGENVSEKTDVRQGTLALMILKTLETLGPLHGYGIARRIEQTSGGRLSLNYGTVYPALLKLEPEGFIASEWGSSENNRKAKYYKLTRAGRTQVKKKEREWQETSAIMSRFLSAREQPR
ncbi:MAG TPA: PadR family transcriptional regulator [Bryobacteraceae bacterium]|nr:PadR family transcriptional regulator [Bryobacteraceae bacterium]